MPEIRNLKTLQKPKSIIRILSFFFSLFILSIYFWLHFVFVDARGLSLVEAGGGYSLARGLLIAVASLVVEHGL